MTLRLVHAVHDGEPWVVMYCLSHLDLERPYAKCRRGRLHDLCAEQIAAAPTVTGRIVELEGVDEFDEAGEPSHEELRSALAAAMGARMGKSSSEALSAEDRDDGSARGVTVSTICEGVEQITVVCAAPTETSEAEPTPTRRSTDCAKSPFARRKDVIVIRRGQAP